MAKSASKPAPPSPLRTRYDERVGSGAIQNDPAQRRVLEALEALTLQLPVLSSRKNQGFFSLHSPAPTKHGLYIWGDVGRGKSMLMDLFFEAAAIESKRRIHFHAFMQEVHARIHTIRQSNQHNKDGIDPVIALAKDLLNETCLLCFDELQAGDVTDATLLYRLFEHLFAGGMVVVSTSNHPPSSLYTGGVQAERFAKFITLIETNMQVISLSSQEDYRYKQAHSTNETYVYPLGKRADAFIEALIAGKTARTETIQEQSRHISFTLYDKTIGRFTFAELCEKPLGPADYLAIAARLKTVILTDIPQLSPQMRNEAKRFVTLIDALYEGKVHLLCTAAVAPEEIYSEGDGAFEFKRTVSRLIEMQSANWGKH